MQIHTLRTRATALCAGIVLLVFSGWASADPPARAARLGYIAGPVSFSPAGEDSWNEANINRPLTSGDRLWTDDRGRAEIQLGGAAVRMNENTSVSVVNLDDRITQLQLAQGTLHVRVRRLGPNQVVEVDTPNLAFTLRQPGEYRISVDPQGTATDVIVRKGKGEAYGTGVAYAIDASQPYRFSGTGLRDYQYLNPAPLDAFDLWAMQRDRNVDRSASARYVSPDVVGYQDLDAHGSWRRDPSYGNVWVPSRVAADWAPYRDGHWSWVDPWGWTWIDDAPWGYAVSHYGRWTNMRGTWGWVPGPVRTPAYYAPALVAFVGGSNFQITLSSGDVGGVAWFPLAPREVYSPSYPVSRRYFENINRSNTVVNNTVINNTYNTYNTYNTTNVTNVVNVNRVVPGAVTAVPRTVFVQSQPVARAAVTVSPQVVASAPVTVVASVVPTERSVRGGAAPGSRPPGRVFERPVVANTAPPAAHAGLAAQLLQLVANPGKPLDDAARKQLKPAVTVPAPAVTVVAPAKTTLSVVPPALAASVPRAVALPAAVAPTVAVPASVPQTRPPVAQLPPAAASAPAVTSAPPAASAPRVVVAAPVVVPPLAVPASVPQARPPIVQLPPAAASAPRVVAPLPAASAPRPTSVPSVAAPPVAAPASVAQPPTPAARGSEARPRPDARGNRAQPESAVPAAPPAAASAPPAPALRAPEPRPAASQATPPVGQAPRASAPVARAALPTPPVVAAPLATPAANVPLAPPPPKAEASPVARASEPRSPLNAAQRLPAPAVAEPKVIAAPPAPASSVARPPAPAPMPAPAPAVVRPSAPAPAAVAAPAPAPLPAPAPAVVRVPAPAPPAAPPARQIEPRPPGVATSAQPAPNAERRSPRPRPAASTPQDLEDQKDQRKRDDEKRGNKN